jgi:signal transduction histidine kinase
MEFSIRALLEPKSRKPSEAFRERTIRYTMILSLIYFTVLAAGDLGNQIETITIVWYGFIFTLIASVLTALRYGRVRLAARLTVLSMLLILMDPSKAFWSPGTIVFSLMFTFLFKMILNSRRDIVIAVAINLSIYAWLVVSSDPSPLSELDYFAKPAPAMLTIYMTHLIIIGITHYIRRDQQQRDRMELLLEQHNVDILRQFLGRTSHDLRTSLSTIYLKLHLLKRRSSAADHQTLSSLEASIEQLKKMLLSMIEMSQLDDTAVFEPAIVDVRTLLADSIAKATPAIERKHHRLEFAPPLNALLIEADGHYLAEAITNILDNAIAYTPEGGTITIEASFAAGQVVIAVKDTGPGIPPDKTPFIFDRFYRGDEARNQTTGLNGLGLAISKKIIDLHGGQILVEGLVGQGSTFTILLPAYQPPRTAKS